MLLKHRSNQTKNLHGCLLSKRNIFSSGIQDQHSWVFIISISSIFPHEYYFPGKWDALLSIRVSLFDLFL